MHCKAPYYVAAKALPLLRLSEHAHVIMVAPVPACNPESLSAPAVPCAVISQIRGLYVVGMAAEFDGVAGELGTVRFNAIWEVTGQDPSSSACLGLLASAESSGTFYFAADGDVPAVQMGPRDYTRGVEFTDWATSRWLETALRDASLGGQYDSRLYCDKPSGACDVQLDAATGTVACVGGADEHVRKASEKHPDKYC